MGQQLLLLPLADQEGGQGKDEVHFDHLNIPRLESFAAMRTINGHTKGHAPPPPGGNPTSTVNGHGIRCYRYEVLKGSEVPPDVDVAEKEKHLSEQDFESVFQMSKDSFDELPKWRRTSMKKEAGLF